MGISRVRWLPPASTGTSAMCGISRLLVVRIVLRLPVQTQIIE